MFSEVRSAARGLLRWRGGAVVAALTLSIGIGTTTALYALVRGILPDLPGVPELGRVARIYAISPSLGVERGRIALGEFDAALSKATSFRAIGAYAGEDALVGTGPEARPVVAGYASAGFFAAMAVPAAAGRVVGATPSRVLRMVLVREGKLIGAAVGTGLVFTTLATRALFAQLTQLAAIRPSMWVGALLLAAGVAAAAVMFATYRIVRLEPAAVLRRL